MRLGYSILLGELIDAAQLEYRDCEHFQVVCPQCQEPVFKVHRAGEKEQHYLAHYAAKAAYQDTCELRAARYTPAELEAANHIARNQRLQYFLDKLRGVLAQSHLYSVREAGVAHRQLNKAPGLAKLRDAIWDKVRTDRRDIFERVADDWFYQLELGDLALTTTFSKERQRQIARDMWLMLTSVQSRAGFDFLFNHAFLDLFTDLDHHAKQTAGLAGQAYDAMADYMEGLANWKRAKAMRLLSEMNTTRLPSGTPRVFGAPDDVQPTYLMRLYGGLLVRMAGALLALPYFEMLRQRYAEPGKDYPLTPEQVGPKVAGPTDPVYPQTPGTQ